MSNRGVLAGAMVAVLLCAVAASAQEVRQFSPASVLVMPFDATANKASFQIVSRIGPSVSAAAIQTHWIFYAADCRHLVNVTVWLTENDTIVMDPRAVQGQNQALNPPENNAVGSVTDLSGERGVVTVTAQVPDGGSSLQLIGGWNIADTTTNAAFGADAIGLVDERVLPDPGLLDGGLFLPSFDPSVLGDSQVIAIGLEAEGDGIVPIPRPSDELDGAHVCCDVGFVDNLEAGFSLPTFCFECVGFATMAGVIEPGEVPLIPPSSAVTSPGFIQLRNCRSGNFDGSADVIGQGDFQHFIFAFHGQAIGPFGAAMSGTYTRMSMNQ